MTDELSRRDWMKIVGAAGAGSMLATHSAAAGTAEAAAPATNAARAEILPLTSTSEVFVPPRGRAFNKFSFDFPEPSVAFDNLRFAFIRSEEHTSELQSRQYLVC